MDLGISRRDAPPFERGQVQQKKNTRPHGHLPSPDFDNFKPF
jgi:hypothetical protein